MIDKFDGRDPIDYLAEEFTQRFRSGNPPSIKEYVEKYPELADEINEVFPSVAMLEQLRSNQNESLDQLEKGPQLPPIPSKLHDDFQILRVAGRGGMGIVYEAVQRVLQRRVALKILNDSVISSPKHVHRFAREARSAATLHHTNIVPVFSFGQTDGTHYYVMQFINGAGLDEIVSELRRLENQNDADSMDDLTDDPLASSTSHSAELTARALRDGLFERPRKPGENLASTSNSAMRRTVGSVDEYSQTKELNAESNSKSSQTIVIEKQELSAASLSSDAEQATPIDPSKLETENPGSSQKLGMSYWKSIVRMGVQVADALQYAHSNRVLHRDIKPSNLILDSQGTVWVTDFGLAKQLEEDDLTRTGDVVGTLRYMSPEQLDGKADARSDIYSLGLSLYEMLTLRPAFDETTHGKLLQQKSNKTSISTHSINRKIPRDLETIILKACEADPKNRYQTAGELAEDLQRFLDDEPIRARRANPAERLVRWTRRNPYIAFWIGTAASLLIAVAAITSVYSYSLKFALNDAITARKEADASLTKARIAEASAKNSLAIAKEAQSKSREDVAKLKTNVNDAVDAFGEIVTNLSKRGPQSIEFDLEGEVGSSSQSQLTQEDIELLNSLLPFYEKFVTQVSDDWEIRGKSAAAYRHMGEIYSRLEEAGKAEKSYREALNSFQFVLENMPKTDPNLTSEYVAARARTQNDLGVLYASFAKDTMVILKAHTQVIRDLSKLKRSQPDVYQHSSIQFELARSYDLFGSISIRSGMANMKIRTSAEDRENQAKIREANEKKNNQPRPRGGGPRRPPRREQVFDEFKDLFPWLKGSDRQVKSLLRLIDEALGNSEKILTKLNGKDPSNAEYRLALAKTQRHRLLNSMRAAETLTDLSTVAKADGDPVDRDIKDIQKWEVQSGESFEAARSILQELVDDFPSQPQFEYELADTLSWASYRLPTIESVQEAEHYVETSLRHGKSLVKRLPNVPEYRALLANTYGNLAIINTSNDDRESAFQNFELSRSQFMALVDEYPNRPTFRINLARISWECAKFKQTIGIAENDRKMIRDSIRLLNESFSYIKPVFRNEKGGTNGYLKPFVASINDNIGDAYMALGETDLASIAYDNARHLNDRMGGFRPGFRPGSPRSQPWRSRGQDKRRSMFEKTWRPEMDK